MKVEIQYIIRGDEKFEKIYIEEINRMERKQI